MGDNSTFDNDIEASDDSLPPTSILHVSDNSTISNKSDTKDEIIENDDDMDQNTNQVNDTERLIDINHLGCSELSEEMANSENRSIIKFEEGDNNQSNVISPREQAFPSLEIEESIDESNSSTSTAPSQNFTHDSRSLSSNEMIPNSNCIFHKEESPPQYAGDTSTQTIHIPVDMRSDFKGSINEKFDKNRCHNFSTEMANQCVNIWKFVSNGKIICFGTLVNSVWLLTSASCITKYDRFFSRAILISFS